jgi:hypothetical protein
MTGPQFHETRMGRVFFEVTLPKLLEQLERLNGNLERLLAPHDLPERRRSDAPRNDSTESVG